VLDVACRGSNHKKCNSVRRTDFDKTFETVSICLPLTISIEAYFKSVFETSTTNQERSTSQAYLKYISSISQAYRNLNRTERIASHRIALHRIKSHRITSHHNNINIHNERPTQRHLSSSHKQFEHDDELLPEFFLPARKPHQQRGPSHSDLPAIGTPLSLRSSFVLHPAYR